MGSAPSTLSDDEEESFPSTSTTARRSSSSSSFTEDFRVVWIEGHEADAHVRLFARVDEIVDQAIEMARCTGQAGREAKRRTRLLGMLCTLVFGEQPYAPSLRVLRRTMVRNPTEQFALFRLDARTDGTLAFFQKPRDLAELATALVSVGETVADPLVRQHCVHLMIAFIQTDRVERSRMGRVAVLGSRYDMKLVQERCENAAERYVFASASEVLGTHNAVRFAATILTDPPAGGAHVFAVRLLAELVMDESNRTRAFSRGIVNSLLVHTSSADPALQLLALFALERLCRVQEIVDANIESTGASELIRDKLIHQLTASGGLWTLTRLLAVEPTSWAPEFAAAGASSGGDQAHAPSRHVTQSRRIDQCLRWMVKCDPLCTRASLFEGVTVASAAGSDGKSGKKVDTHSSPETLFRQRVCALHVLVTRVLSHVCSASARHPDLDIRHVLHQGSAYERNQILRFVTDEVPIVKNMNADTPLAVAWIEVEVGQPVGREGAAAAIGKTKLSASDSALRAYIAARRSEQAAEKGRPVHLGAQNGLHSMRDHSATLGVHSPNDRLRSGAVNGFGAQSRRSTMGSGYGSSSDGASFLSGTSEDEEEQGGGTPRGRTRLPPWHDSQSRTAFGSSGGSSGRSRAEQHPQRDDSGSAASSRSTSYRGLDLLFLRAEGPPHNVALQECALLCIASLAHDPSVHAAFRGPPGAPFVLLQKLAAFAHGAASKCASLYACVALTHLSLDRDFRSWIHSSGVLPRLSDLVRAAIAPPPRKQELNIFATEAQRSRRLQEREAQDAQCDEIQRIVYGETILGSFRPITQLLARGVHNGRASTALINALRAMINELWDFPNVGYWGPRPLRPDGSGPAWGVLDWEPTSTSTFTVQYESGRGRRWKERASALNALEKVESTNAWRLATGGTKEAATLGFDGGALGHAVSDRPLVNRAGMLRRALSCLVMLSTRREQQEHILRDASLLSELRTIAAGWQEKRAYFPEEDENYTGPGGLNSGLTGFVAAAARAVRRGPAETPKPSARGSGDSSHNGLTPKCSAENCPSAGDRFACRTHAASIICVLATHPDALQYFLRAWYPLVARYDFCDTVDVKLIDIKGLQHCDAWTKHWTKKISPTSGAVQIIKRGVPCHILAPTVRCESCSKNRLDVGSTVLTICGDVLGAGMIGSGGSLAQLAASILRRGRPQVWTNAEHGMFPPFDVALKALEPPPKFERHNVGLAALHSRRLDGVVGGESLQALVAGGGGGDRDDGSGGGGSAARGGDGGSATKGGGDFEANVDAAGLGKMSTLVHAEHDVIFQIRVAIACAALRVIAETSEPERSPLQAKNATVKSLIRSLVYTLAQPGVIVGDRREAAAALASILKRPSGVTMWLRFEPGAPLVRDSSGWNLPIHVNLVDRSSGMKGAKRKPLSASTRLVPARGAYRFADSKELSDALKAHEAREKRKSSADARMRSQVTMILKQQMRLLEEEFGTEASDVHFDESVKARFDYTEDMWPIVLVKGTTKKKIKEKVGTILDLIATGLLTRRSWHDRVDEAQSPALRSARAASKQQGGDATTAVSKKVSSSSGSGTVARASREDRMSMSQWTTNLIRKQISPFKSILRREQTEGWGMHFRKREHISFAAGHGATSEGRVTLPLKDWSISFWFLTPLEKNAESGLHTLCECENGDRPCMIVEDPSDLVNADPLYADRTPEQKRRIICSECGHGHVHVGQKRPTVKWELGAWDGVKQVFHGTGVSVAWLAEAPRLQEQDEVGEFSVDGGEGDAAGDWSEDTHAAHTRRSKYIAWHHMLVQCTMFKGRHGISYYIDGERIDADAITDWCPGVNGAPQRLQTSQQKVELGARAAANALAAELRGTQDFIPPTAGVRQASPSARTRAEAQKADEARLLGNTANLIGGADVTIAPKKGSAASIAKFNDLELPESVTSSDEISGGTRATAVAVTVVGNCDPAPYGGRLGRPNTRSYQGWGNRIADVRVYPLALPPLDAMLRMPLWPSPKRELARFEISKVLLRGREGAEQLIKVGGAQGSSLATRRKPVGGKEWGMLERLAVDNRAVLQLGLQTEDDDEVADVRSGDESSSSSEEDNEINFDDDSYDAAVDPDDVADSGAMLHEQQMTETGAAFLNARTRSLAEERMNWMRVCLRRSDVETLVAQLQRRGHKHAVQDDLDVEVETLIPVLDALAQLALVETSRLDILRACKTEWILELSRNRNHEVRRAAAVLLLNLA